MFLRGANEVLLARAEVSISASRASAHVNLDCKDPDKIPSYSIEAFRIAAELRACEKRLGVEGRDWTARNLRAIGAPIRLVKDEERITNLYPVFVLYENGIELLEFRIFSPARHYRIEEFIDKHIKIYEYEYDYALVAPGIASIAPEAYARYTDGKRTPSIFKRFGLIGRRKRQRVLTELLSRETAIGDFSFKLAQLANTDNKETITTLALTLFQVLSFAACHKSSGLGYVFQRLPRLVETAAYWRARSNIFIMSHSNQQWKASHNQEVNIKEIGMMLAASASPLADERNFIPASLRAFEDYGCYVTESVSLWIWSGSGISTYSKQDEAGRAHLILEHQALMELVDYGYMLHRLLLSKCRSLSSYKAVLDTRSEIIDLKHRLSESTPFGELRSLLKESWKRMGLEELQSLIDDSMEIRSLRVQHYAAARNRRIQFALTIFGLLFSVLAINPTMDSLWKLTGLPQLGPQVIFSLALSTMAIVLAIGLIFFILYILEALRGDSPN